MKKLLLVLLMIIPLSSCIPAVIIAGAAAGGTILYDKRGVKQMSGDRRVTEVAQSMISRDKALKGRSNISVATYDGVVLMVGQTQTPQLRTRAYNLVSEIRMMKGMEPIKRIWNEITIAGPASLMEESSDAWLTTKVRTALFTKSGFASTNVKVVTENSIVYLMGLVTPAQGEQAANITRRISGVRKVVKVFQYQAAKSKKA